MKENEYKNHKYPMYNIISHLYQKKKEKNWPLNTQF